MNSGFMNLIDTLICFSALLCHERKSPGHNAMIWMELRYESKLHVRVIANHGNSKINLICAIKICLDLSTYLIHAFIDSSPRTEVIECEECQQIHNCSI